VSRADDGAAAGECRANGNASVLPSDPASPGSDCQQLRDDGHERRRGCQDDRISYSSGTDDVATGNDHYNHG